MCSSLKTLSRCGPLVLSITGRVVTRSPAGGAVCAAGLAATAVRASVARSSTLAAQRVKWGIVMSPPSSGLALLLDPVRGLAGARPQQVATKAYEPEHDRVYHPPLRSST